jgi:hypothetical protein
MLVPKATVDEDDFPPYRKGNVWSAWQKFAMQTESVSSRKEQSPYCELRFGVLLPDRTHDATARFDRESICHHK